MWCDSYHKKIRKNYTLKLFYLNNSIFNKITLQTVKIHFIKWYIINISILYKYFSTWYKNSNELKIVKFIKNYKIDIYHISYLSELYFIVPYR